MQGVQGLGDASGARVEGAAQGDPGCGEREEGFPVRPWLRRVLYVLLVVVSVMVFTAGFWFVIGHQPQPGP